MSKTIRIKLTILTNKHGWGVGLEMVNGEESVPYFSGSYYFPRHVRRSATKSIHKTIAVACEFLPSDSELVFEGTHPIFEHQKHKILRQIREVLGEETNVLVFHHKRLYGQGRTLAEGALKHLETIDERLGVL